MPIAVVGQVAREISWTETAAPERKPAAAPAKAPGSPAAAKPAATGAALPEHRIDLAQLEWAKFRSPRRDPFAAVERAITTSKPVGASANASVKARESLVLKAVWLQDNGSLAVINDQIVGEGDSVLGFRIEKIAAGGVVVQGVDGPESVGFSRQSASAGGTNNAAGNRAAAPGKTAGPEWLMDPEERDKLARPPAPAKPQARKN